MKRESAEAKRALPKRREFKEATVNIQLEQHLKAQLQEISIAEDVSISKIVRQAIRDFLKSRQQPAAAA